MFIFFMFSLGAFILVILLNLLILKHKISNRIVALVLIPYFICFAICFAISAVKEHRKSIITHQLSFEKIKEVQFQGKVISSYTEASSTILCILIDSSNTTSFYDPEGYPLKIENGIAVVPIGYINKDISEEVFMANAEYIIVNKNNNLLVDYIIKDDTLTKSLEISFSLGYLKERHLTIFDDIINQNKPKVLE